MRHHRLYFLVVFLAGPGFAMGDPIGSLDLSARPSGMHVDVPAWADRVAQAAPCWNLVLDYPCTRDGEARPPLTPADTGLRPGQSGVVSVPGLPSGDLLCLSGLITLAAVQVVRSTRGYPVRDLPCWLHAADAGPQGAAECWEPNPSLVCILDSFLSLMKLAGLFVAAGPGQPGPVAALSGTLISSRGPPCIHPLVSPGCEALRFAFCWA